MTTEKERLISALKLQPISVGILASDWLEFSKNLNVLSQNQLKLLHFDIADGQFSPFFTVGSMAIQQFPKTFIKDVHLMVKDQFSIAQKCVTAGADIITLQIENTIDLEETLRWLKMQKTILCGLAICPNTPLESLYPHLPNADLIQILTLDPRTGEKANLDKIAALLIQLFTHLNDSRQEKLVSVDGAMTLELALYLKKYEINWVVSGSALFSSDSFENTVIEWKKMLSH
ncbi:ribulose phosphate epimerase [Rodentibacter genomosp. 2]|uniref:ribulose phosphate epimerase n=1 Tax=Rodentibacter genomosp. 2 TaxID=1908266 RepID=UPI000985D49B|nr:ribulose phosphate epimerase [Rodentibacter genomosp. 2]